MSKFAEWRKRIVAVLAAALFLITSLGFSGLVLWQMHKDNQKAKEDAGLQAALKQAQEQQAASNQSNKSETTSQSPKEGALQGTQLANFTPIASIPELQTQDTVEGTGDVVKAGDTVTAHYTGAVAATGVIFQSSHDSGSPIPFSLNGVIQGWTQGVPGMKVGGTRRLLIPAAMAYGANPPQGSGIPANADLVFDVELVKIGK